VEIPWDPNPPHPGGASATALAAGARAEGRDGGAQKAPARTFKSWLPSGKRLQNYGKSPCLMGKLNINGHFQ